MAVFHGTTILAVKRNGKLAVAGDGQVTLNEIIIKHHAVKVRKIYKNNIIVGFAGATADALNLFDRFESKLERFNGNLTRSAVELAKDWRTDKYLRQLEAFLVVADKELTLLISGSGEVIEPDDDILSIGSGAPYAIAASRALLRHTRSAPEEIVKEALKITAGICIYTNDRIVVETL